MTSVQVHEHITNVHTNTKKKHSHTHKHKHTLRSLTLYFSNKTEFKAFSLTLDSAFKCRQCLNKFNHTLCISTNYKYCIQNWIYTVTETNKQHSGSVIDGFFSCFVCVNLQCSSRIIDTFVCYSKGKNTVFKNYLNYLYKLYRVQNGSNKIVANKSKQCVSFVFLPYVFDEELCCTARLNKHLKLESLQSHAFHSEVANVTTSNETSQFEKCKYILEFFYRIRTFSLYLDS